MPGPGTAARIKAAARNSGRFTPSIVMIRRMSRAKRNRSVPGKKAMGFASLYPSHASWLMRPCQAERHHLLQRALHRRGRKQRQRIDRHGAIMLGAINRVLQRAMLGHQPDGVIEIAVADF